jgi:hypothetical protein
MLIGEYGADFRVDFPAFGVRSGRSVTAAALGEVAFLLTAAADDVQSRAVQVICPVFG